MLKNSQPKLIAHTGEDSGKLRAGWWSWSMGACQLHLIGNFKKRCSNLRGLLQFKNILGKKSGFSSDCTILHCQLFTPRTSATVSKSLCCQCKNPKRDFAGPVGNKPQRTRNPAKPHRARDGRPSRPSPPLGPAGRAGSPAPRVGLETFPRSGHVAAD